VKFCTSCWREKATAETRALYPSSDDVPRERFWPVHCWADVNGVECILRPRDIGHEGVNDWLFWLVQNLSVAGGLSLAAVIAADNEAAKSGGEIAGLAISEAFFRRRCEVLEASVVRQLSSAERLLMTGCCPLCAQGFQ
jgi:hypothetical protein